MSCSIVQSFTDYKEQLVANRGLKILLNLSNFVVLSRLYCLYGGVDQYSTFYS